MNRNSCQRRIGSKPAGRTEHARQRLRRLELINRGPHHRSGHLHARAVHRHEDYVSGLEPNVVARVAAQQVVVQIERRDGLAGALHLEASHIGALGHAPRRIQRREHGAERADPIRPRLRDLANHVDLIHPHVRDRDVKPCPSVGPPFHPGVDGSQARV